MGRLLGSIMVAFGFALASEVVYYVGKAIFDAIGKNSSSSSKKTKPRNEVWFFPDQGVACLKKILPDGTCGNPKCKFEHGDTSLKKLLNILKMAKHSLDVCVFLITCDALGDALIAIHRSKVRVRVISNDEGLETPGSQIGKLRASGVPVRCNNKTTFLMHHKFVTIDKELLVNGSFNWTRQAVTGNHENLQLTSDRQLVEPYITEFEKLWDYFKPSDPIEKNS